MPAVLFITHWYPPRSGHFIQQIAQAVCKYRSISVLVINQRLSGSVFSFPWNFSEETSDKIKTIRISYHHFPKRLPLHSFLNILLYQIAVIKGLLHFSKMKIRFDLIHVHVLTRAAIIPFLLKILKGKPYVITEYWTRYLQEPDGYKGWFRKRVTAIIARNAGSLVAISDHLKHAMEKQGITNRSFQIIAPAIDTNLFHPIEPLQEREKKRFIHISTFSEKAKNTDGILRSISLLSRFRDDFECFFIGGASPWMENIHQLSRELGLTDKFVFFRGVKFELELAKEIQDADFLVMFSNFETFSVVIQQSLACGKPVIATSIPPLTQLLDTSCSILVPPGDDKALCEAINQMLDHHEEFNATTLHERVDKMFGFDRIGRDYEDLYKTLCGSS